MSERQRTAPLPLVFAWFIAVTGGLFALTRLSLQKLGSTADLKELVTALVLFGLIAAIALALRPGAGLRRDAASLSAFNRYLVRAAFFAVLFIGVADLVLTAAKVEGFGLDLIGQELARRLNQPAFRGTWVHGPLIVAGFVIALRVRGLGFPWLALLIVLAELCIVISRFVFSYEQTFMGDLVRFWYSALFLFAAAHTLFEDGHVRVDVFYAGLADHRKGQVNAIGSVLLGMTFCWTILLVGMGNARSVISGPIADFEVTPTGSGLFVKYLMAGYLAFFATTMLLQFVSLFLEAVADWRREPGHRDATGAGTQ